jgi:8-hydroxy-5-deazaflavin:NADPH oxidoreductase
MQIGVFGTGTVGSTIGSKLVEVGHEVKMGSRTAGNEKAVAWSNAAGKHATQGTYADAAAFGELLFNCTAGAGSVAALQAAGAGNLGGKILVDVCNPLDFSKGMPPSLTICNTDSLAEQLQRAFPELKVVKALNTMTAAIMVDPGSLAGEHDAFLCGNDAAAKGRVTELLKGSFGWKNVVDLGDLTAARGQEMFVIFWVRLYGALKSPTFNVHLVH